MTASAVSSFPSGICRLCTGEKSDLNSIFDKNLPMKVMKLADVKIAEGDGLPTTLCIDCESEIDRCLTFIEQMKWSDTKLREALQSPSKVMFEECNIKQEQIYPDFADETACDNETEQYRRNEYNAFEDDPDDPNEKPGTSEIKVDEDPCMIMKEESMIVDVNLPAPSSSSKHVSYVMSDSDDEVPDIVTPEIVLEIEERTKKAKWRLAMTEHLPEKSKQTYDNAYADFMKWRGRNSVRSFSENVMIAYFESLSKKWKPSSMWSHYSMIKSTIYIKHNIDISGYSKLTSFLRRQSEGYTGKKAKVFSCDEIKRFLNTAPDEVYLLTKVSMVFGIMGACRRHELHQLKRCDVHDLGSQIIVTLPAKRSRKKTRSFTITGKYYDLCKKYMDLRPKDSSNESFFLNYQKGKCTRQNVGINKMGSMGKVIAAFLNLPNPQLYTGHCFRRSSNTLWVDEAGDISEGRSSY